MTRNALEIINTRLYTLKLQVLSLADNQIKSLPDGFANSALSKSLQKLDLSKNQFKEVPKVLSHCRRLVHLEVNENQLIRVPDRLSSSLKPGILSIYKLQPKVYDTPVFSNSKRTYYMSHIVSIRN